jgi:hypothetical protein
MFIFEGILRRHYTGSGYNNHYWNLHVSLELKFLGECIKTVGTVFPYGF